MKLNSEFYKKKELEENSIFNKKQRIKKKIVLVLVRVKFSQMPLFRFK